MRMHYVRVPFGAHHQITFYHCHARTHTHAHTRTRTHTHTHTHARTYPHARTHTQTHTHTHTHTHTLHPYTQINRPPRQATGRGGSQHRLMNKQTDRPANSRKKREQGSAVRSYLQGRVGIGHEDNVANLEVQSARVGRHVGLDSLATCIDSGHIHRLLLRVLHGQRWNEAGYPVVDATEVSEDCSGHVRFGVVAYLALLRCLGRGGATRAHHNNDKLILLEFAAGRYVREIVYLQARPHCTWWLMLGSMPCTTCSVLICNGPRP